MSKRVLPVIAVLGAVLGLPACSLVKDHANDYRTAQELPPMTVPQGATVHQPHALYPIPPETVKPTWTSKKFEAPQPQPLVLAAGTPTDTAPQAGTALNQLSRGQDGNGYPTLRISGGFNQIWDYLAQALHDADVKVDDRNQSLGLYYLSLAADKDKKMEPFQLKMTRGQSDYVLSLQKDDDTLAPQAVASALFDQIQAKWPNASGDNDGKARASLHR